MSREDFIAAASANGVPILVAVVGLDRFSRVRGAIGYELAERLVAGLAGRAARLIGATGACRLGPDSFGFFVCPFAAAAPGEADFLALVRDLEAPADIAGFRISAAVRVGYALGGQGVVSAEDLLHRAEIGLDQAREAHRRVYAFSAEDYGDPARRLSLMNDLNLALERGEMRLVYQPQVRCDTRKTDSVEALLRWEHPARGDVPPGYFIPMAEETGQIRDVTEWSIRRALFDSVRLEAAGHPLRIAINLSGRLLSDPNFTEEALRLVRERAASLTFEITESAAIEQWEEALEHLRRFAEAGVRISIDDYGSGLSSLAYVQQLPAHELKIDRMFVSGITHSHRDPLLVRSTIELGHALELDVVAEGVQDHETFALVKMMGCDAVQGYFVSEALEFAELLEFLRTDTAAVRLSGALSGLIPWAGGLAG